MNCAVVIPAAGTGTRFGGETPKQFLPLGGRPLIAHTIEKLHAHEAVERIIVCVSPGHLAAMQEIVEHHRWSNVHLVRGGDSRQESVYRGLEALARMGIGDGTIVAVHDAVRPFLSKLLVTRLLEQIVEYDGVIPASPLTDTIHRVADGLIAETPDRSMLAAAQTPQCFRLGVLRKALSRALSEDWPATDEAAAVARCGYRVKVIEGDVRNLKITRPSDFESAERELERWAE